MMALSARSVSTGSSAVTRLMPRPLLVVLTAVLLLITGLPILYMLFASVNSDAGVAAGQFWPSEFSLDSYLRIWSTINLGSYLVNSFLVGLAVSVASATLATGAAYVLARFHFGARTTILRSLVAVQGLPGTLMVLPVFVVFSSLGQALGIAVIGSLWGLFLAQLSFALPLSIWILATYIRGLPIELEEAARTDGANNFQVLLRIVLPLSWPAIIVAAVLALLHSWNDVLFASVLTSPQTRTVAVGLQTFAASQEGGPLPLYSQLMAASLVAALPVAILYLTFQRYLVGGMTAGAVK